MKKKNISFFPLLKNIWLSTGLLYVQEQAEKKVRLFKIVCLICRDRTADENGIFYMCHGPPFKMVYGNNTGFGIEAISALKVHCIVSSCVLGMI